MVSFVRSSIARVSLLAATLLVCAAVSSAEAQQNSRHLDNKELTDLLDAKLDKPLFNNNVVESAFRRLQTDEDDDVGQYGDQDDDDTMDETMESEAPTGSPTPSATFDESVAPTMEDGSRGLESFAPTSSPTMTPTEASGAWRPSSAGVAAVSLIVGVASAFAMA